MKYYVMANRVDESGVEVVLTDYPKDCGVKKYLFLEAVRLSSRFTEPLTLSFSNSYPEGRKLIDLIQTTLGIKVVSKELRSELENEGTIEFIPVMLTDHRGAIASKEYTVANFMDVADCLDRENSVYVKDSFDPEDIFCIEKFVIDESKVPEGVGIFRVKGCMTTVIVKEPLKEKIEAAGMDGPLFVPVEEFDSALYLGV